MHADLILAGIIGVVMELTKAAAQRYSLPVRTVQRWVTEGRLTASLDRGRLLVDTAEMEQLTTFRRRRGRLPAAPPG